MRLVCVTGWLLSLSRLGPRVVFALSDASFGSLEVEREWELAGRILRRVLYMSLVLCHSGWLADLRMRLWWWARSATAPFLLPLHAGW